METIKNVLSALCHDTEKSPELLKLSASFWFEIVLLMPVWSMFWPH